MSWSSVAWGDYDNDHDLDLLLSGYDGVKRVTDVYRNDGGVFVGIGAGLTPVSGSSAAWGDYDNDGDLDIVLSGTAVTGLTSRVYRNDNGTFVDAQAGLLGEVYSSAAWGDYDSDGDLDLLLTGSTIWTQNPPSAFSKLYRNDGGTFTDTHIPLEGVCHGSVAWGDYDNDGDLDLLLSGWNGTRSSTKLYRNDNGTFTDTGTPLPQLAWSSVAWGDYDNDHDLDLLLSGYDGVNRVTDVYRNDSGVFVGIGAGLTPVSASSAAWGDYDNDGDLDIVLSGTAVTGLMSRVYHNKNGVFEDAKFPLPGVFVCSAAWGDYDNDADLDLLITGNSVPSPAPEIPISVLYRNDNCSQLQIAKAALPDTGLNYHGLVTYTLMLTNTGPVIADLVRMTDTLPSAVEFMRWITQSAAIRTSNTITWAGPIAVNDTVLWSWVMTHTGTYNEVITNTAQYLYERAEQTGSDSATFFVKPAPVLAITKTVTPKLGVSLNDIVTYTVELHNTDHQDAPSVWATDSMPSAVEFVGWLQKNGAEVNDNLMTWNGPVSGSGILTWQWLAKVLTQPQSPITNSVLYYFPASQQSGQSSDWFTNNVYPVSFFPSVFKGRRLRVTPTPTPTPTPESGEPDLVVRDISVLGDPKPKVGESAKIEMRVKNQGTKTANDFECSLTIIDMAADEAVGTFTAHVDEIEPDKDVTLTFTFKFPDWTTYTLQGRADHNGEEGNRGTVTESDESNNLTEVAFKPNRP